MKLFTRVDLEHRLDDMLKLDSMGVSPAQVNNAIHQAQMQSLPFLCATVGTFFFIYALLQGLFLQEPATDVKVMVAIISGVILLLLRTAVLRDLFPTHWSNGLYIFGASLPLITILLRFYVNQEPKQSVDFALLLLAAGVIFLSSRWFLVLMTTALIGWEIGALWLLPPSPDWLFFGVVVGTAAATALMTHIARVRLYRRSEILRIIEQRQRWELHRLNEQIKSLNTRLEEKVRQRTEALQEAYERLERLDQTKTDFLTVASHELRTPLTILNFYNQMFLDEQEIRSNGHFLKWAEGIQGGISRMEQVVESMLDMAKIDSRTLALHHLPLNIHFVLQAVRHQFADDLQERQIKFSIVAGEKLPTIEADTEAMQKVFYHLIQNAIKYTPDNGRITITTRQLQPSDPTTPDCLQIEVADTGIGIALELQEVIFEKFYQTGELSLHSSGKTKFKGGGAGLGLAIVKGIVEAHHGQVWVESAGHSEETLPGSRFFINLPLRQPQSSQEMSK